MSPVGATALSHGRQFRLGRMQERLPPRRRHQHRAALRHRARHRAEQRPPEHALAMASDDEDVGLELLDKRQQGGNRLADAEVDLHIERRAELRPQVLQSSPRLSGTGKRIRNTHAQAHRRVNSHPGRDRAEEQPGTGRSASRHACERANIELSLKSMATRMF